MLDEVAGALSGEGRMCGCTIPLRLVSKSWKRAVSSASLSTASTCVQKRGAKRAEIRGRDARAAGKAARHRHLGGLRWVGQAVEARCRNGQSGRQKTTRETVSSPGPHTKQTYERW